MNRISRTLASILTGLVLLGSLLAAPAARADDTLTLKSGKVITGEIIRELDGYVWIKYSIGGIQQTEMIAPADITKIERDTAAPAAPETPATPVPGANVDVQPRKLGVPRAAVITLGEGGEKTWWVCS
jgi:hypothetical protein